jgi:hypothetical protein
LLSEAIADRILAKASATRLPKKMPVALSLASLATPNWRFRGQRPRIAGSSRQITSEIK